MINPNTHFLVAIRDHHEGTVVRNALTSMGFWNITVVDNGPSALKALEARGDYAVISAWELPELGGLRLAKEFRRHYGASGQPCLLIVPDRYESEKKLAEGVDISGYLPRPLSIESIIVKIKEITGEESHWPIQMEAEGDRLTGAGRPREALVEYKKTLEQGKTRLADVHTEIGRILHHQGSLNQAIDHLERAVLAQPRLAKAHAVLGQAYLDAGRPTEARRALKRAISLDPQNDEQQRNFAESLLQSGYEAEAESLFNKLLEKHPRDRFLLNRKGIALRKQGKYTEAVVHYRQALQIDEQDENLHFNLGRCYFEIGRFGEAMASLNQALNINPQMGEARKLLEKIPLDL